jgi:2-oxoglutarate ferredoxin oxidoreductase subunit delta
MWLSTHKSVGDHPISLKKHGSSIARSRSREIAMPAPKGFVVVNNERCKGCGFCVEFCPTKVLALSSAFNSKGYHAPYMVSAEKCSGCDLCGMYCPDFAIFGAKFVAA